MTCFCFSAWRQKTDTDAVGASMFCNFTCEKRRQLLKHYRLKQNITIMSSYYKVHTRTHHTKCDAATLENAFPYFYWFSPLLDSWFIMSLPWGLRAMSPTFTLGWWKWLQNSVLKVLHKLACWQFCTIKPKFSSHFLIFLHIYRVQIAFNLTQVPFGVLTVTSEDSSQVQIPCTRTHPALVSYWKVMSSWMALKTMLRLLCCLIFGQTYGLNW